ncbi:hypothetical protein MRX96_039780 [Rhipicephalus microplus]
MKGRPVDGFFGGRRTARFRERFQRRRVLGWRPDSFVKRRQRPPLDGLCCRPQVHANPVHACIPTRADSSSRRRVLRERSRMHHSARGRLSRGVAVHTCTDPS